MDEELPAAVAVDAEEEVEERVGGGAASASASDPALAALESKLAEQEKVLRDLRAREAADGGERSSADQERLLAEARKRRELARKAVQTLQARLSAMQSERREKSKKLDKLLLKQSSAAAVRNPDVALPSVAVSRESKRALETGTHLLGSPSRAQPLSRTGATAWSWKSHLPHALSAMVGVLETVLVALAS